MEKQKQVLARHLLARVTSADGDLKKPGVFLLYKGNVGPPSFVGRADSNLYENLMGYRNHKVYKYFKVMPSTNKLESFHMQCMLWHTGAATLDNGSAKGGTHPNPPYGVSAACNYPGCDYKHETTAGGPSYGSGGVSF